MWSILACVKCVISSSKTKASQPVGAFSKTAYLHSAREFPLFLSRPTNDLLMLSSIWKHFTIKKITHATFKFKVSFRRMAHLQGDEIPLILYRCHTLVYLSRTHPIYRSVLSRAAVPSDRTFSHMPVLISAVSRPETSALKVQSVESYKNRKSLIMRGETIWRWFGSKA